MTEADIRGLFACGAKVITSMGSISFPQVRQTNEAASVYRANSWRDHHLAVRRLGATSGSHLSSGLFAAVSARCTCKRGFFDELRRRGFIEGQNFTVEYRAFGLHFDLISQYTAELVKAQPDAIYAGGDVAVRAVQHATKTIPIVEISGDMVGEGLVESLARPNGNTTGISILATELDGKRQEILTEAVPGLRRKAALADSSTLTETKAHDLQEAARAQHRPFNSSDRQS